MSKKAWIVVGVAAVVWWLFLRKPAAGSISSSGVGARQPYNPQQVPT